MSQGVPKVHLAITIPQLMLIDKESASQSEVDTGQHIDHPAQVAGNQQPVATERIEVQLLTIGTQKHPDSSKMIAQNSLWILNFPLKHHKRNDLASSMLKIYRHKVKCFYYGFCDNGWLESVQGRTIPIKMNNFN